MADKKKQKSRSMVQKTLETKKTAKNVLMRERMIDHISNPANPIPERKKLPAIAVEGGGVGNSRKTFTRYFSPYQIDQVYAEGLEIRRTRYADRFGKVDDTLFIKAEDGDVPATKLLYQRFEGFSEKHKVEHSLSLDLIRGIMDALPVDYATLVYETIKDNLKEIGGNEIEYIGGISKRFDYAEKTTPPDEQEGV